MTIGSGIAAHFQGKRGLGGGVARQAGDGERRIYVRVGVPVSFVFQCHLSACGMIVAGIHPLNSR